MLGDIAYDVQQYALDDLPFPGIADPLYLASYVAAFGALSLLIHRAYAKRDREAWIDSAIIVVAAASLAAVFVISPMLDGVESLDAPTVLALAYPVLDLVLLAGLVRLLVGMGRLRLPMTLLTTSFAVYLVADVLYNASVIHGFDDHTRVVTEVLYLAALVLLAGSATAPGVAELASPDDADALVRPSALRLARADDRRPHRACPAAPADVERRTDADAHARNRDHPGDPPRTVADPRAPLDRG